ncbi:DNA polymerase/3'-5' exonuclease PolX [Patescibacteria group bacterium]
MKNQEIAQIFYEIGDFLEMERASFRPYAYKRAAVTLESLEEDISDIFKKGGKRALEKIPGIGKNLADKIEEYLKTGKIKYFEDLKKKTPIDVEELIRVEGMGPKKVKILYEKLGIRSVKDLEKAAKKHKIAPLFGFGEKTEKNVLEGIEFLKRSKGRFLLGEIIPKVREVKEELKKLKEIEQVSLAGSLRRMKETIGDVDFLVVSKKPQKVMDYFCSLKGTVKIWSKGSTKSSIRMQNGYDMDIRVVPQKSYGAALQYFTGSKEHNIVVRKIAIEKGLKLNEYGLFRGSKMITGKTEKEVYKALGLSFIPSEMRENQGEIEAARKGNLPNIIEYGDIKGDLHCHSDWDGGEHSIERIAKESMKIGYEYLGITDHTKFLRIEKGLNEKQLVEQRKEIDKLNKKFKKFKILQGCEANIMADGSIDIKDDALAKLDYVIAGIHSQMKMKGPEMTERMVRAMKNPHVDIISHPTGRLIQRRDEYEIDMEKIFQTARETGTILEINSSPIRLDLNDQNIRRARELGVKMVITTDSHHIDQLQCMEFGISQARRGWAEKKDIINSQSLEKLLTYFN